MKTEEEVWRTGTGAASRGLALSGAGRSAPGSVPACIRCLCAGVLRPGLGPELPLAVTIPFLSSNQELPRAEPDVSTLGTLARGCSHSLGAGAGCMDVEGFRGHRLSTLSANVTAAPLICWSACACVCMACEAVVSQPALDLSVMTLYLRFRVFPFPPGPGFGSGFAGRKLSSCVCRLGMSEDLSSTLGLCVCVSQ